MVGTDGVFIELTLGKVRDESRPDSAVRDRGEGIGMGVPIIEVAYNVHALYFGRPDREAPSDLPLRRRSLWNLSD